MTSRSHAPGPASGRPLADDTSLRASVTRFLDAWLGTRQLIQAANFNRFQRAGLSATQFMALNVIPVDGAGMTLSELARRLNLGTATVAKTIDSLEERGLLTRTRSEADRRQVHLAPTTDGKALQTAASAEFHAHMAALFVKMLPDRREGLVRGLEALLEAAKVRDADAASPDRRSSRRSPPPRS